MSATEAVTQFELEEVQGMVSDLDSALLKMALLAGNGAPEELFVPMRTVAVVREMLNDAIEKSTEESEADHG